MELVNDVNLDDEQNESDEDDVESGEECFEGNGEQYQLGNQSDNGDGEQMRMLYVRWGLSCIMFKVKLRWKRTLRMKVKICWQDETEDDASDEEQGYITSEQVDATHLEENDSTQDKVNLHFIDCIVEGEQKADANVVLSCLEAAFRALKLRFPHVEKIIVQSDNAKNLAGRQTKCIFTMKPKVENMRATHTFRTSRLMWITILSREREEERLDFKAPYRFAVIPPLWVFRISMQHISTIYEMGSVNVNFTGVTVLLNSDDSSNCVQAQKCKKRLGSYKKNMHPELSFKVSNVIQECWKAGDNKELGSVKIAADGVYTRLDEMQLQKAIRLSELPLPGKIRAVYQRIGSKPQAEYVGKIHGRPRADDVAEYGEKKIKVSYWDCDMQKDLTKWPKLELQAYLCHNSLKKTGNKSELIIRIKEHMEKIRH
eukprot:Em0019g1030a